jgi:pimeloyl-ACP methyl ester carboxylesterase
MKSTTDFFNGLSYQISGSGPAVVFLHGFALDLHLWNAQFPAFSEHFTTLRYDLRGFGRSAAPSGPYTHTADLAALLDHLELREAALIGLSLGGGVAIDFALSYPGRARSLVLVSSTLGGYEWSEEQRAADRVVWAAGRKNGVGEAKRLWQAHPLFRSLAKNAPAAAAFSTMLDGYSGWHWHNRDLHIATDPPATTRLHEIELPVLVVTGERDSRDFKQVAERLVEELPQAVRLILTGAGHLPPLEKPDIFNLAVLGFLGERD